MEININSRVLIRSALIEEIIKEGRIRFVRISYQVRGDNGRPFTKRVVLLVDRGTIILDENGRAVSPETLRVGMQVSAMISSRMTRSEPPQSVAYLITILGKQQESMVTEGRVLAVDTRNHFLETGVPGNIMSQMRFAVSRDTIITDPWGRRISLDDIRRGQNVRVEHAVFQTASLPPQTAAFRIQVLR